MWQLGRNASPSARRKARRGTAALAGLALLAGACSSGSKTANTTTTTLDPVAAAEARVTTAQSDLTKAQETVTSASKQFCGDAKDYVVALDRYGKLFTDSKATVGDVKAGGSDLASPKDAVSTSATAVQTAQTDVASAQKELADAAGCAGEREGGCGRCVDERDGTRTVDHDDPCPSGDHQPGQAGRGRLRQDLGGHHGVHPARPGDGVVQLSCPGARDRMAEPPGRRGLPHRPAASRGGGQGHRLHDRAADPVAAGGVLQGSDRRDLRAADGGRRPATPDRQRAADDGVRRPGDCARPGQEAGRDRSAGRRPADDRDGGGADRPQADRLLDRADRRHVDTGAHRLAEEVPDGARRPTHGSDRRRHVGRVPTGPRQPQDHRHHDTTTSTTTTTTTTTIASTTTAPATSTT